MTNILAGKAVVLNAPKSAGKDVIGKCLSDRTGASLAAFKEHLYTLTAGVFNVPVELLRSLATDRATKEAPNELLSLDYELCGDLMNRELGWSWNILTGMVYEGSLDMHLSPRQALIFTSECVIKPALGDMYFGEALAKNLDIENGTVITDSGFDEEIEPLIDKIGADNVIIVQFGRDGCSFEGDSRNYIEIPEGCPNIWLDNDRTVEEFVDTLLYFIDNYYKSKEV